MDSDEFRESNAEKKIMAPPPEKEQPTRMQKVKVPLGLPPYLASLYGTPLLTREDEQYWFRRMNFLKYRAAKIRNEALESGDGLSSGKTNAIERDLHEANEVLNFLMTSNLRLVVSIAKRHWRPGIDFNEMVSDGNMSLRRAAEKFDYSRGNKFSTYATWAIMKNFARSVPTEQRQHKRFQTGHGIPFDEKPGDDTAPSLVEANQGVISNKIDRLLDQLDVRDKEIIILRFGLKNGSEVETLEQVGHRFGVTKERIRQIEAKALRKLRHPSRSEQLRSFLDEQ